MPIAKLIHKFRGEVLAHKIVQLKLGDLKIFILCGLLVEVSSKQAHKVFIFLWFIVEGEVLFSNKVHRWFYFIFQFHDVAKLAIFHKKI